MTCEDLSRLLATGAPVTGPASEHLAGCSECAALARLGPQIRAVSSVELWKQDLEWGPEIGPVRPMASFFQVALAAGAIILAIILITVELLGFEGWKTSAFLARVLLAAGLVIALSAGLWTLPRLMAPGQAFVVPPLWIGWMTLGAFAALILLYPWTSYPGFADGVGRCLVRGFLIGALTMSILRLVIRRGYVVEEIRAGQAAGLLGGLTGLAGQFVFCPGHDAGHYFLAHFGTLLLMTLAGGAFGARHVFRHHSD